MSTEADAGASVKTNADGDVELSAAGNAVSDGGHITMHNFRDVAGPGYALHPSGTMARGQVFRSMALTAGQEDLAVLKQLGISTIVDLRTAAEVAGQPDVVPAGVEYVHVDILAGGSAVAALTGVENFSVEDARREMAKTYEQFVLSDTERAAFGRAVHAVALSSGASVVHCTEGKDRTGWMSAILQLLAGVGEEDVVADYLITREQTADFDAAIRGYVEAKMPGHLDAINAIIGVQEDNIRRSLAALAKEFGTVQRYLVEGAGLEESMVDELGARLRAA